MPNHLSTEQNINWIWSIENYCIISSDGISQKYTDFEEYTQIQGERMKVK